MSNTIGAVFTNNSREGTCASEPVEVGFLWATGVMVTAIASVGRDGRRRLPGLFSVVGANRRNKKSDEQVCESNRFA